MDAIKKTQISIGSAIDSSGDMPVVAVKRPSPCMSQSSTFGESANHFAILTPATETAQVFESLVISRPVKRTRLSYKIVKANARADASSQEIEHSTGNLSKKSHSDLRSKKIERATSKTNVNSMVVFERFPAEIRQQILEQVDLQFAGSMPAAIQAMRPLKKTYVHLILLFNQQNSFELNEANMWTFKGLSETAVLNLRKIGISVCTCQLTDGNSNHWFNFDTVDPAKTGAINVREVSLRPYRKQYSYLHYCKMSKVELKRFVLKCPYYLRPFQSLTKVTIDIYLFPWAFTGNYSEGVRKANKMRMAINSVLGVDAKVTRTKMVYQEEDGAQRWVWTAKKGEVMNWSKVADGAMESGQHDFAEFLDWDDL